VSGGFDRTIGTHFDSARVRRLVVELAVVFAAYYLAGVLGQATTHIRSNNIGPVWPAYGVALAAVIMWGPRIWPALAAAAFLVAMNGPVSFAAAFGQAAGTTLAALGGGAILQLAGFDRTLSRLHDALNFIVIGAAASTLISATLGVASLWATGVQSYMGIGSAWLIYWLGDATGALLVTPLVLTFGDFVRRCPIGTTSVSAALPRLFELAALILVLVLACFLIFGDFALFSVRLHVLAFGVLPFVIWAAIRFGVAGMSLSALLIAAVATIETALGTGPFSHNTTFTNAALLDVFFAVLSVSGLILAAVIAERQNAEAERERLIAEKASMEARLRLAAIVESSDDAIVRQDLDGTITDWNSGAQKLYGYTVREAIGKSFFSLVQPDTGGTAEAPDVITRRESVHVRQDGTHVPVSLTLSPIRDAFGHLVGEAIIVRDATERRRAAALREELTHLGRVQLLSALTGALAHEMNQPLAAVAVNVDAAEEMLAREPARSNELRDLLDDIRNDNRRAGDILHRVRTLMKREPIRFGPVDISETIRDVIKLVQGSADHRGIRIAAVMPREPVLVRGDRVQVQQVVLNLLMNACDAVNNNEPPARYVRLRTVRSSVGIAIHVEDSGAGLPDDELSRIFEPFYTTKNDGTGLGLSICNAIVADHGGSLDAVRNLDRGMTFIVRFPYWQSLPGKLARQ
jgi:PAS domain S-box-containing protein